MHEIVQSTPDTPRRWSGEHGMGVEKRDLMPVMFSEDDLNQQQRVKCAFDPTQILNPGKAFPNSTAAPRSAASTSTAASSASPTCHGFEGFSS